MDWSLRFRESQPVTVELCEQALAAFVGAPVTTLRAPYRGNPRDGFARDVTITGACPGPGVTLVMQLQQEAWTADDDADATTRLGGLRLVAPAASFATKLAAWRALREAFALHGWTDRTLISFPRPIVEAAEAAGEYAIARQLRADITRALVAYAKQPDYPSELCLHAPLADDLEAVLEAQTEPERVIFLTLIDCGFRALPRAFTRFPNVECLTLDHNPLDGRALRVSLPKLYMLGLAHCPIATLSAEDLAGFPVLRHLTVSSTPLRELDPNIIAVCPKLERVDIRDTPLANDAAQLAGLRARAPNVVY